MKKLKVHSSIILVALTTIFFLKLLLYFLIKNNFLEIDLGGGNDADYYDDYATGVASYASNTWPEILRLLNSFGIYSREIISYLLLFLSLIVIPIITAKLAGLTLKNNQKYYLYVFLLLSIYPTVYFYTFDIYRDVFMIFSFLVGCVIVKMCLNSPNYFQFIILFALSIVVGLLLLGLRAYLGYAFLLSLLLWKIKFTKKRLIFLGVFYFAVLFVANYAGLLNVLTEYRSAFEELKGGSTLGLSFSNPIMFIPNLILSFLGQMLGLYITNPLAILLLLLETVPFLFMLVYVFKNIRLADNFVRFLIIFFVIYASVWLIGNDNLGTAVRLRFYNYFAIYICFFYILRLKTLSPNKM